MIFYDWKIALTYNDCVIRLVQPWEGVMPLPTTHSLIAFVNFNAINLVLKMLLVQLVLEHL